MKFKNAIALLLTTLAIVLEALPFGAVCLFANPEGEPWRRTFSYFDLVPFGYANFGPLITALLSCVLLLCLLIGIRKRKLSSPLTVGIALVAFLTSLTPLLFGLRFFSITGALISVTLLCDAGVLLWYRYKS